MTELVHSAVRNRTNSALDHVFVCGLARLSEYNTKMCTKHRVALSSISFLTHPAKWILLWHQVARQILPRQLHVYIFVLYFVFCVIDNSQHVVWYMTHFADYRHLH